MDEFKLKKTAIVQRGISLLYPLTPLLAILYLVKENTLRFDNHIPLLTLGLLAWLGYETLRLHQRFSFKLSIGTEGITLKKETTLWADIVKAKLNKLRFGMTPVIILYHQNGNELKIPAVINGLPFITSIVEKNIKQIEREGESF